MPLRSTLLEALRCRTPPYTCEGPGALQRLIINRAGRIATDGTPIHEIDAAFYLELFPAAAARDCEARCCWRFREIRASRTRPAARSAPPPPRPLSPSIRESAPLLFAARISLRECNRNRERTKIALRRRVFVLSPLTTATFSSPAPPPR